MGLEEALLKARATLESGDLHSEAAVRLAVIVPVLTALGWDPADPKQWVPEMPVPSGRVDDALKSDTGTPLVFVEAKKHGNLSAKAEEQLFDYAAKQGVPMLVLTDGDTWDLYLAMAAGEPHERRFAHVELTQNSNMATIAEDLSRFLRRDAVVNQQANFAAQQRLAEVNDRLKGKRGLASGWLSLLQEGDDLLRELLIDRVEERTGSRPWAEDVDAFLAELADRLGASAPPPKPDRGSTSGHAEARRRRSAATRGKGPAIGAVQDEAFDMPSTPPATSTSQTNLRGFVFRGEAFAAPNGSATLVRLVETLAAADPHFLERWAAYNPSGRLKRPRAVRSGHELLRSEKSQAWFTPLRAFEDWWILTNLSNAAKLEEMKRMTEVAGLTWEADVKPLR